MKPWLKLCWLGTCYCGECLASFCLWSLWLALAILFCVQIFIASTRELTLPGFVLRELEHRLAASGMTVAFGRASFDPAGHVLIQEARFSLPHIAEPIVTAQSVYISLDPWSLLLGRFVPRELQVSGANLRVAAMLSPTGRSEPLVHDLDFILVPGPRGFELPQLAGWLSTLRLAARGSVQIPSLRPDRDEPLPLAELLARNYPAICRQLIALTGQLAVLESPTAALVLTPSENRGATVDVTLLAAGLELTSPLALEATRLQATTRVPLLGDTPFITRLEITAESVQMKPDVSAKNVHALIRGRMDTGSRSFDFQYAELTAAGLSSAGLATGPVALRARGPFPVLQGDLTTRIFGEPLALHGWVNPVERSANFRTAGRFDPDLLGPLGQKLGRDLRRFVDFKSAPAFNLGVAFTPGWKFAGLAGHVSGDGVRVHRVQMDAFAGDIAFDGRSFRATDAVAFIGDNFARGSFEQDFTSREFRFLLTGRLRPPVISGWFSSWWGNFWRDFDFAAAAPEADVDVRGRWGRGSETAVYVFADSAQPVIRGVGLDHAITRLFIRPHFYDILEVFVTQGAGSAQGNFTRRVAPGGFELESLTFAFDSNLELPAAAALAGPEVSRSLEPFVFASPPTVRVSGRIDGPAAPQGPHRHIQFKGHGTGAFTLYDFPLQHLEFSAELKDEVLSIKPLAAGFAGGTVSGEVRLTGPDDRRRLGFALSLREGSLRDAATVLEAYFAKRRGEPPAANSRYIEGTAQVRMALDLEAEGDANDPFSFTGNGRADLSGQGLGRIRMLGLLSELLNFTALRFDTLRTNFSVAGNTLNFPHVNVTGPDAAVTARGAYQLERKELDFYARIFPFQESSFILKSVVGLVLSPLSGVLEVKLTGKLDQPEWAFVIGPTNFLRSIFTSPNKDQPADVLVPLLPMSPAP